MYDAQFNSCCLFSLFISSLSEFSRSPSLALVKMNQRELYLLGAYVVVCTGIFRKQIVFIKSNTNTILFILTFIHGIFSGLLITNALYKKKSIKLSFCSPAIHPIFEQKVNVMGLNRSIVILVFCLLFVGYFSLFLFLVCDKNRKAGMTHTRNKLERKQIKSCAFCF